LAGTVDALKDQLDKKDTQISAKDNQIDSLIKAGERGDILLKSIQDRVRQLEAPQGAGEQEAEPEQGNKVDTTVNVQPDEKEGVQSKTTSDQAEEQENEQNRAVVEGKFEEVDQPTNKNVRANDQTEAENKVKESAQEPEQGTEKPKKGIFRRMFSKN